MKENNWMMACLVGICILVLGELIAAHSVESAIVYVAAVIGAGTYWMGSNGKK